MNILLHDLRPVWEKSDVDPLDTGRKTAAHHGVGLDRYDRKSETFARVKAGLVRRRHER